MAVKKTIPQTTPKGKSRTMHAPTKVDLADRPTVKDPENTKIPLHVRSVFLNNMIDACLDMYAYAMSAYERVSIKRSTSTNVAYNNSNYLKIKYKLSYLLIRLESVTPLMEMVQDSIVPMYHFDPKLRVIVPSVSSLE